MCGLGDHILSATARNPSVGIAEVIRPSPRNLKGNDSMGSTSPRSHRVRTATFPLVSIQNNIMRFQNVPPQLSPHKNPLQSLTISYSTSNRYTPIFMTYLPFLKEHHLSPIYAQNRQETTLLKVLCENKPIVIILPTVTKLEKVLNIIGIFLLVICVVCVFCTIPYLLKGKCSGGIYLQELTQTD